MSRIIQLRSTKITAVAGLAVAAAVLSLSAASGVRSAAATTSIRPAAVTTIAVGTQPWDAVVDTANGDVYVSNSVSNTVSVISESTLAVIATISVGTEPEGVGVNATTDTVYVANATSDTVSVINGATNTVTATIAAPAGDTPDSIAVDPTANVIYVGTYISSTVVIINGATHTVTGHITLPAGHTRTVAINPAAHTVYADMYDSNTVAVINDTTDTVSGTLTALDGPTGVAVNTATGFLYVAMGNFGTPSARVAVFDNTGSIWNVVHTTAGLTPAQLAVDTATNIEVASLDNLAGGNGSVAIINGATDLVTGTVTVGKGPNGLSVDPGSGVAFVANEGSNTVSAFPS